MEENSRQTNQAIETPHIIFATLRVIRDLPFTAIFPPVITG